MNRPRIIIVEDDTLLSRMYATKFSAEGFDVLAALDGEMALQFLHDKPKPDFMIMDMMMPKLSGFQVLEQMKNNPELAQIPVLILSNLQDLAQVHKTKELGVVGYLVKSNYTPSQIADFVKDYLAKK